MVSHIEQIQPRITKGTLVLTMIRISIRLYRVVVATLCGKPLVDQQPHHHQ
ncbi:hypothetical protein HanXRQr2_Chr06g0261311 [Helianthus annuus]|uniref:Uncharacterized protein n=1 Tax=Helianthus annuus TaxID=4232 RepID=A0A9K3ITA9_HELAN|nr:hypothetical protein HanXRQr2_Chr06g0261311 [Helianthus annuus]KAJ0915636.1 hypothetical protein HanPSC8_Chr06g0252111 [Helianthus annuus]